MRNYVAVVCMLAGVTAGVPASLSGQTTTPPPTTLCFRGHPLPQCKRFVLLELHPNLSLFSLHKSSVRAPDGFVALDLGLMTNRSDSTAVGGSLEAGLAGDENRFALELRRRRWFTSSTAGDFGFGPVVLMPEESFRPFSGRDTYGVTSHVGLVFGDLFSLTATLDAAVVGGHRRITPSIGGRLGSYAAGSFMVLFASLFALSFTDES